MWRNIGIMTGKGNVEVKVTLEQATKDHRERRGIAVLFL
jgi:hypothetical protein